MLQNAPRTASGTETETGTETGLESVSDSPAQHHFAFTARTASPKSEMAW
jgi:hypothetical protein